MEKPSDYREVLYADYSSAFGELKTYDYELQRRVYEHTYGDDVPPPGVDVLDLGCGKGEWLRWLKDKGVESLTGVDVSESECRYIKDGGMEAIQANVLDFLEDCDREFDVVHAKDLFEHFTKDEAVAFLQGCHRVMKPGGKLWILTFNAQSPLAATTRYGDFTHELAITPQSLAQAFRATGFEVESVRGYLPVSGGIKGKIRQLAFVLINSAGGLLLKLRHGGRDGSSSVERFSVLPDVIGKARKPGLRTCDVPRSHRPEFAVELLSEA